MDHPGIVRQQDRGGLARNSAHGPPQIRPIPVIVHSSQVHGLPAKPQRNVPVAQDINALPAQRLRDGIGIHTEIVIAEHRVHPVTRPKAPKQLRRRSDIPPGIRDEVSGERNDVRIQPVGLPHRFGKPFFGEKETVVNVGNLHDAQAMKRTREGIQPDALIVDGETIAGTPAPRRFPEQLPPNSAQSRLGAIGQAIEKVCRRLPRSPEPEK